MTRACSHWPEQLDGLDEAIGWSLDHEASRAIDAIVREHVRQPIGPEFMAPPARYRPGELRRSA